ncbi:MAG: amino acid adenylation domain-containing protein [Pseudonocardiaceae bacterium]
MVDGFGLCDAFLSHVDRQPDAPALVWQGQETTYGELFDLADRTRARLAQLDLEPHEPVGVLAKKSPNAVALILACLLSRRRFLLPSPALADQSLTSLFAQAGCRHVLVPDGEPGYPPPSEAARAPQLAEASVVSFMLTTSGSTGLPKIVPLGQDAVDRFIAWAGPTFDIRPGKTVLNYAPLNFDLCLLDVWTTLAHGGRVVLVDPDRAANGRYLLDLLTRHEIHVIQAVPMFFGLLLDAAKQDGQRCDVVEHVIFTGDAIPDRTLAELPHLFPGTRLYNIYGCTETNDSFIHEVDPAAAIAPVPIGRPLPGVHTVIVDAEGAVLDGHGTGELYVSTPFQTAGYLDRARHADKFVGHPQGCDDRRYFRTGDLVRRDADGRVFLVGRRDFQVKVRGVAINTAEVEQILLEHPDVLDAAVVARPDPIAGRRLLCAVQRAPASGLNSLVLRTHCARRLAQAAIPSTMRIVDEPLPKTSTGKVDRNAVDFLRELPTAEGKVS